MKEEHKKFKNGQDLENTENSPVNSIAVPFFARVLVINTDELIRWSLKEIFTQEGYEVNTFSTAEDAFQEAMSSRYDLIIADFGASEEIGIEMLGKIKKAHPSIPIVILSSYTNSQTDLQLRNLKIFSVVEKPFHIEQIRAIAKKALAS